MDELLQKYNDYMRLENCKVVYELENDIKIEVVYKEENFPHLIGLHKLKDIQLIQFFNDKSNKKVNVKTVIRRIKNSNFTSEMVRSSKFFEKIKDRYENFSYDNLTTLNYTDAIVDFNSRLIHSKLKSDYLLFEKKKKGYNYMAVAYDRKSDNRYIETFFNESTDKYIHKQKVLKVEKFTLYDECNKVIVTDRF